MPLIVKPKARQDGLTLIEVLVALVVLAFGLIGIAGMQASSLRSGQDAYLRTQAMAIAQDMADRMKMNWQAALDNDYFPSGDPLVIDDEYGSPSFTNCASETCTPEDVAFNDIGQLASHFTDVYGVDDGFVPTLPEGSALSLTRDGNVFIITVTWPSVPGGAGATGSVVLQMVL